MTDAPPSRLTRTACVQHVAKALSHRPHYSSELLYGTDPACGRASLGSRAAFTFGATTVVSHLAAGSAAMPQLAETFDAGGT